MTKGDSMPRRETTHAPAPLSIEMTGRAALDELYGRLVPIHYALMVGPFGDKDVERRVRDELETLLAELDAALGGS